MKTKDQIAAIMLMTGNNAQVAEAVAHFRGVDLSAAEPVKVRNDDVGFVDFLNADRPYICRKTEGTCYLLIDRETGGVVGYRKYDDENHKRCADEPTIIQSLEAHLNEYGRETVGQDIAAAILVIRDLHKQLNGTKR